MFFEIANEGARVLVRIHTDIAVQANRDEHWIINLRRDSGEEIEAHALAEYLRNLFSEKVQKTRRSAYEEGYREGRGHKKKRTYFFPWLEG